MTVSIVAAVSKNGVIGEGGKLPWQLKDDLKHFAQLTKGSTVVMGRKTFESIVRMIGGPLPDRQNIVITRNSDARFEDATIAHSFEEALNRSQSDEIFIIGGEEIFKLALPQTDRVYLTEVDADIDGDAFFPDFDLTGWAEKDQESFAAGDRNEYPFTIKTLERRR
jgi:dihydrofolate reductase